MAASDSCVDKKKLLVIAIDLGTTYSGYAMSFASDKYTINAIREDTSNRDRLPGCQQTEKVPTALLLKPDGTFDSFGFKARRRYNEIVDSIPDGQNTWMYFERFKMDLHSKPDLSRETMCKARNGKMFDILTIFSHVMRHFKLEAMKQINLLCKEDANPDLIKWVITVPAIWCDGAKQIMREAAYKAGLTSQSNPEKVVIALEPEGAAVYCESVNSISPGVDEDRNTNEAFTFGTRYLLADIGGGTVDVTVHAVGEDKKVRELHHATGGAWGGTYVDKNFVRLLKRIFGKALIKEFQSNYPCDWVDLVSVNFESAKRTAAVGESVRVQLPFEFTTFFQSKGCAVQEQVKMFGNDDIYFRRGAITLKYPEIAKLFNPVIESITSHLESILTKVDNINFVLLVGGFATCQLLQERIKEEFASRYNLRVITAFDCSLAVVMGSVLFGHNPDLIASRRLKYSYGVSCSLPFEEEVDPDSFRFVADDGEELCSDRFNVYAKINDEIAVGQEILRTLSPISADATEVYITVHLSSNTASRYTTEEDVKKIAHLTLPMPNTEKGASRLVNVAMRFGETEIQITSEDTSSGQKVRQGVKLDFLEKRDEDLDEETY